MVLSDLHGASCCRLWKVGSHTHNHSAFISLHSLVSSTSSRHSLLISFTYIVLVTNQYTLCRSSLLSGGNVRWPRRMLPLVSHGEYADETDWHQTVTLRFPQYAVSVIKIADFDIVHFSLESTLCVSSSADSSLLLMTNLISRTSDYLPLPINPGSHHPSLP